jgi:hypothetical protein
MIVCGTASVSASVSTSASQSASVSASQSASVSTSVSTSVSSSQSVSVSHSTNNDCQPPWEAGILVCYDGQNWWNWQQQNGEVRIYYLGGDNTKDYIQNWFGEWQNSIGNPITGIDCGACPSVSTSASVSASASASHSAASVSHSASVSQSVSASHSGSISASASSSSGGACAPTGPYTPSFVRYAGLRCDGMGEGSGCYTYNGYNGYTSQSLRYITNASDYYSWYNLTANVGEWYRYESSNDS